MIGFSTADPTPFFDEFLLWTRRVLRHLEAIADKEIEIDMVLPLRVDYRLGQGTKSLITPSVYDSTMWTEKDPAELSFTIPKEVFAGLDKVRLRGVGLSVTYFGEDLTPIRKQNRIFWMELITPPMATEDGGLYYRPRLVFRNVRFYSPEMGIDYSSSRAVHNLDPSSPSGWKLRVSRTIIQLLDQQCDDRRYTPGSPQNICLHLTVAAIPQQVVYLDAAAAQERERGDNVLRLLEEALDHAKQTDRDSDKSRDDQNKQESETQGLREGSSSGEERE